MEVPNHMVCDVCGAPKGETNHWLMAVTQPPTPEMPGEIGIAFGPIDADLNDLTLKREHICSHACAIKRFSQWLGTL
jgi:hypothetical protein